MEPASNEETPSLKALGRLLLVGVAGTVLALLLAAAAIAIASALPGKGLGYLTGGIALALFVFGIVRLLRATEPAAASNARSRLSDWDADEVFQTTLAQLRGAPDKAKSPAGGLLLLSLVAFTATGVGFRSVTSVALLVPILLIHEFGHLVAMRAFGYQDVRVFFIPLLGAATTGRKEQAPAWQQAVVSLMGPAPGLIAAFGFVAVGGQWLSYPVAQQAIGLTIIVNAVNLLPFEPFDGGRIAGVLLFANHPRLRVVFGSLTAGVLGLLALRFGATAVAVVAALVVARTSARYRVAACAARFRASVTSLLPGLPSRLCDAEDQLIHQVFVDWRSASRHAGVPIGKPRALATAMSGVYDIALVPSAGWGARVAVAIVYAALLVPAAFMVTRQLGWF